MRALWTSQILTADPGLQGMFKLDTTWENGLQYYLPTVPDLPRGHVMCIDAPWRVSGILETPFWADDFAPTYGDGSHQACVSMVISDWTTPGILYDKRADQCSPQEIADEVWAQLTRHVNACGQRPLPTTTPSTWVLDSSISGEGSARTNTDALVAIGAGTWKNRPGTASQIPNLVLAGDYQRGQWGMANMEAANANGRDAANKILQRAGRSDWVQIKPPYQPPEWAPLQANDAGRYAAGLLNQFDT